MRVQLTKTNPDQGINYFLGGYPFPGGVNYSLDASESPNLVNFKTKVIGPSGLAEISLYFWQSPQTLVPTDVTNSSFVFQFFGSTYTTSSSPIRQEFFSWNTNINSRILSAQSLADQINSDININWRYKANVNISSNVVFVTLKAKHPGTIFDPFENDSFKIILDGVVQDNTLFSQGYQNGSNNSIGELLQGFGYAIFCEIYKLQNIIWGQRGLTESSDAELLTTLEASWNSSNSITFDLSPYLRPLVSIPVPGYKSSIPGFVPVPEAIESYFIRYGEKFNGGYSNYGQLLPNTVIDGLDITFPSFTQFNSSTGSFEYNGSVYNVNTEYNYTISTSSLPYIISVFVSTLGVVQRTIGTAAVNPVAPEIPVGTFLLGYIHVPGGDLTYSNYPTFEYPFGPIDSVNNIENTYLRKYYTADSDVYWCSRGAFTSNFNPSNFILYWQSVVPNGSVNEYREVKFCTNQPNVKLRRRTIDSEYLYFYSLNDQQFGPTYSMRVAHEYTLINGTTVPVSYSHTNNNISHSGLFQIDLNAQSIGFFSVNNVIPVLESKHWVERRVNNVWERITDYQYYDWDQNTETTYYPIVFRNSFGCFDNFLFDGTQTQSMKTDPLLYTQTLSSQTGWLPTQKYKGVFDANPTVQLKLNSGWVDVDHYVWLSEMLASTDVLIPEKFVLLIFAGAPINTWLTSQFDQLLQCNIVEYSWEPDDRSKLFNLSITLETSLPKNSITD